MFHKYFHYHEPGYHSDNRVREAALTWQRAKQQRIQHLGEFPVCYSSRTAMSVGFSLTREVELRNKEDATEHEFFLCVAEFAEQQQSALVLSKTTNINWASFISFFLWAVLLITSIFPITTQTDAGVRDLVEMGLEVGEKLVGLVAATGKAYRLRIAMFCVIAGYAVVKKGLEVDVDPAPARQAKRSWSYIGGLSAKAFEHVIYAVRLAPASRAWSFWEREAKRECKFLSVEQMARRSIWAIEYYREYLLNQQQARHQMC